jgi:hypothetical protein
MNKITRFKQRRSEAKVLRADETIINNAKAMLSFHEQIDVATARYLSGELCLSEMADEVNRITRSLMNNGERLGIEV